jgi:hypothetical protein
MTALLSRFACPLLATLGLAVLSAPAQAIDTPFTSRFAQTVRGNVSPVGNTLMTCPARVACAAARSGTASGDALNNNSYAMSRVDIDGDASTFDSSSATVSLPSGSTVVWAGLSEPGEQRDELDDRVRGHPPHRQEPGLRQPAGVETFRAKPTPH